MKRLRAFELLPAAYPADFRADQAALVDAWRQVHHVAQAVAEVGKSWGESRDDDSHSAFTSLPGSSMFWSTGTGDGVVAGLDLDGPTISIENGNEQIVIDPIGRDVAWLRERVRLYATLLGGEARQDAVPAPDLPDHPVASGAAVDADPAALAGLAWIYDTTRALLERWSAAVRTRAVDGRHELVPRLWPHHFDLASLLVVGRDAAGAMSRTIGVGVTPPDAVDPSGYWYVSPWAADGSLEDMDWPELPIGTWVERGAGAMAVLRVEEVAALAADDDHEADVGSSAPEGAIAEFVAAAFNACAEHFDQNEPHGTK
ncbi:MAG: hypothetical protein AAF108_08305 [Planctomycetota bacterium]